ncbi:MAG: hypothetical protein ACFE95_10675 [Candidatus Hodarchaeota archaeon]
MGFCEKCGKSIEEGKVFCDECASDLKVSTTFETTAKETEIVLDHEVFSFKGKHSSKLYKLMRVLPFIVGVFVILIGLVTLYSDSLNLEIPSYVLSSIIVIVGLFVVFLIFRRSEQDYSIFLGLVILIFTFGGVLIFSDYSHLIFPIGSALVGLVLVFFLIRYSKRHYTLFLELAIVILALTSAIVLTDYATIIIAVSFVLIGLLVFIKGF